MKSSRIPNERMSLSPTKRQSRKKERPRKGSRAGRKKRKPRGPSCRAKTRASRAPAQETSPSHPIPATAKDAPPPTNPSILVDAFDPFVVSCYTLEGDSTSLVFQVHSDWQKLTEHVAACRAGTALTLTRAVANEIISREFPQLLELDASNRVQQLVAEQLEYSRRWSRRLRTSRPRWLN